MQTDLAALRLHISAQSFASEHDCLQHMLQHTNFIEQKSNEIHAHATSLCSAIRHQKHTLSVEDFLQEYQLSTKEGIAIMCLAEALLRIPDKDTSDALIESTFNEKEWRAHLGHSESFYVNASSWGLLLAGKTIELTHDDKAAPAQVVKRLLRTLSDSTLRTALRSAMRLIAKQFVLGETLDDALKAAEKLGKDGWMFSYDMLGEGARTWQQAESYFQSYLTAIQQISKHKPYGKRLFDGPSVSIKLTALHPHYHLHHADEVERELIPKLLQLVNAAKEGGIAIAIDAEEAHRLDIELLIFERLCNAQEAQNYNGLGFVLQAYQKRAWHVIDYLQELAASTQRVIPVRLVKGAYWDSEIKFAQAHALPDYPVFTRKAHSDTSYLACALKLLQHPDVFYPQFATHNAHTIASILACAPNGEHYEFQRLFGMGEALHRQLLPQHKSRIYAPIGAHKDLLAYLIRRLLENGANSSFVHQIMNPNIPIEQLIHDPIADTRDFLAAHTSALPPPQYCLSHDWAAPRSLHLGYAHMLDALPDVTHSNYTPPTPTLVDDASITQALQLAKEAQRIWDKAGWSARSHALLRAADLLEARRSDALRLLIMEARKTWPDAIAEWMETIELLRYYATIAQRDLAPPRALPSITGEKNTLSYHPRGTFLCIAPWNFPMAIFVGQVTAALVTGNTVLAKSAEATPACGAFICELLWEAGVPREALHHLPISGARTHALILQGGHINGVAFTGSTATAKTIARTLAATDGALIPLIAETGGQNCLIMDSSCLLEQALDDVLHSAFGSAGQRCSALRVCFVAQEIADPFIALLKDALASLHVGAPHLLSSDIGPVIDSRAKNTLQHHVDTLSQAPWAKHIGSASLPANTQGLDFIAPQAWEIDRIERLETEHFGPILHLIRFSTTDMMQLSDAIRATGYGLTCGIHSRIPARFEALAASLPVGNIYINRSMTGARTSSQPFGGEGLSGTGFKAGGPHYLLRFITERTTTINSAAIGGNIDLLMR